MEHVEQDGRTERTRYEILIVAFLSLITGLSPTGVLSQPSGSWSSQFGEGMGLSGGAYALITDADGNLYVGGSFDMAGGTPAQNIAMWDGSEWHALGEGFDRSVYALALSPEGDLFAGGWFTMSGESPMEYLARWDGSEWHAVTSEVRETAGPGSGPSVHALKVDPATGALYVGGNFTSIDGVEAFGIATWDGENWAAVGAGFQGGGCLDSDLDNVHDIKVISSDDIYVVGNMIESDGVRLNGVAHWDGSSWEALGEGIGFPCDLASAVEIFNSELYVAGTFEEMGGVATGGVAKWNGTSWEALQGSDGTLPTGNASSLAQVGPDLYVGGTHLTLGDIGRVGVAMWSGSDWFKLGDGLNETPVVHTLASFQNQLWASGEHVSSAGGHPSVGIARWEAVVSDERESQVMPGRPALTIEALYPNPARGTVSITINASLLRQAQPVLQIHDVLGRLVDEVQIEVHDLDKQTIHWQPRGIPAGQYIVTIRGTQNSASRQLMYVQ